MARKSRRQKLSGWEWDAASRYARSIIAAFQKPGKAKWLKKQMSRRWRRNEKKELRNEIEEGT